jgi:asparagine synthase (glutamine-hydrolysing)
MLAYDWRYTLAEADLPKVCGSAQLAGVEVGFPFLDQACWTSRSRLPTELQAQGPEAALVLQGSLRGFLPDEIMTKKKQGFGLPFGVWATRHDGLGAWPPIRCAVAGRARHRAPGVHARC